MSNVVRDSHGQHLDCRHPALTRICRALGMCPHTVFDAGGCPDMHADIDPPTLVECVTPSGLMKRAEIMRERGDESCARHLEMAAHRLLVADLIFKSLHRTMERAENLTAAVSRSLTTWNKP